MKKLLLVAAIFCSSSSNILSTYGAENCTDFKPISKACYVMQTSGAEGLCKRSRFVFFQQVCSFYCSKKGQLMQENCHICHDNEKEYPNCNDLMCERVNSEQDSNTTPKYTTPESSYYFENTTTTSTTPTTKEADEGSHEWPSFGDGESGGSDGHIDESYWEK